MISEQTIVGSKIRKGVERGELGLSSLRDQTDF